MRVLVTGVAGFIGMHVARALLDRGDEVLGVDSLNSYYDPRLKQARLEQIERHGNFRFVRMDLADDDALVRLIEEDGTPPVEGVVHLAAQAGVRYSIENPFAYVRSNLDGHMRILELCRHRLPALRHLVYASSSSVYGANTKVPFSIDDRVDLPVSLYAATKRADEILSQTYAHLYRIPMTGLRFFTVYGPWGRPDMAYYSFTDAIAAGRPIRLFNEGHMRRDFTYIDDIVSGVIAALDHPPGSDCDRAPHRVYNLGNNQPVELERFVSIIEEVLGIKAIRQFAPMQLGDVQETYADIDATIRDLGWRPSTTIEAGLQAFVGWYRDYHMKVLG